jgi:hypothetical protein
MSDVSLGEAFARRKLTRMLVNTTPAYAPGQYSASRLGPNDAMLSWVGKDGAVCIVPVEHKDEDWFHRGFMVTANQVASLGRMLPRSFALTPEMHKAIDTAMKKTAPSGRAKTGGKPSPNAES